MNDWMSWLQAAGEGMFRWAMWMNVWCGVMLAAASVADRLLSRRIAPTWRMLLYFAVIARIALPLTMSSPIGLTSVPMAPMRVMLGDAGGSGGQVSSGLSASDAAGVTAGTAPVVTRTIAQFTLPAYVLGIGVLCGAWIVGAMRLRRVVGQSKPSGVEIAAGAVPVLRHEAAGPMLIGAWRPRLVIPVDLEQRAGACGLGWVLKHEAAHVSRGDPIMAALLHTVVILAWPIAAVWIAAARVRGLMEEACDDRVLRGAGTAEREEYGRTLIELATSRPVSRFVPALPFGTSLRSRVRALACTTRWPMAIQAGLVVVVAAALVACAGSRDTEQQRLKATQLENAEFEPFKGSLPIRVTILRSWPKHPKLDFALGQYKAGTPEPDWSIHRILTRNEFAEVLRGAEASGADAVVSRPRLEVVPGGKATVSVGMDVRDGKPTEGFTLDSTVTQVMIPPGADRRRVYTMDLDFARYGDAKTASSASVRGVRVPQGETVALLATGLIGGEMLLVCVSPGPDEAATAFGADGGAAKPAVADTRPLIEFAANIHRVNAPRDYGSPKGDGPRLKWSAYPGGTKLNAAEFAEYLKELRGRAGYALLAAPKVWVYPDQDATMELNPEADSPEATQTIHVRGIPDGDAVLCTGSYARTAKGVSTEGTWSKARKLQPGEAMVWSIHDPELGAWYTLTLQATVRAPGSQPVQTLQVDVPRYR